jgi:hypothetical protein
MKIKTVVLKISTLLKIGSLTSILALTGCISTSHFQSWSGQQEFEGKGGAFVTKDGIDIYSVGTQTEFDALVTRMDSNDTLGKV